MFCFFFGFSVFLELLRGFPDFCGDSQRSELHFKKKFFNFEQNLRKLEAFLWLEISHKLCFMLWHFFIFFLFFFYFLVEDTLLCESVHPSAVMIKCENAHFWCCSLDCLCVFGGGAYLITFSILHNHLAIKNGYIID